MSESEPEPGPKLGATKDAERLQNDDNVQNAAPKSHRPLTGLKWISVCVCLYLAAMLYGT